MTEAGISLKVWPPSDRTRTAVIDRMVQTLSSPSLLSDKYGRVDPEQAHSIASEIEKEAFAASEKIESSDSGINVLQFYSKEISRLIFEAAKNRSANKSSFQQSDAESSGSVNS
eukprot:TRINITY_DN12032_c0_g1_i1.p1 TRINITY_DN12032_c0_g1~~TRINITY_DN12032_c0_g1_i1.p1  ORF type:complete len:114 (-),score=22.18 TRINITY_DN12032_c0_g1_i1:16-357(-)